MRLLLGVQLVSNSRGSSRVITSGFFKGGNSICYLPFPLGLSSG